MFALSECFESVTARESVIRTVFHAIGASRSATVLLSESEQVARMQREVDRSPGCSAEWTGSQDVEGSAQIAAERSAQIARMRRGVDR